MGNKIVIADGFDKNLFESLCSIVEFDVHPKAKITQEELAELLPEVEGLVIRSATQVTPELVDKAPKLEYVIRAGEGTDNIDKPYCNSKDIKVSNTPGANNNSAAEHAIALMFTLLRKTAWANASMQAGKWEKAKFAGNEMSNKKIGIVGFGRIGQIVAKRLSGFDVNVHFYDPFVKAEQYPTYTKHEVLDDVFAIADIVTIHVPLMDATKNLITKTQFDRLQPHALLVNASRGKIVNEDDLFESLKNERFAGAAFDVFAEEPLPDSSPLRSLENIILTPHLGASTGEAQVRVGEMVIHQLKEFFINDQLLNEVK